MVYYNYSLTKLSPMNPSKFRTGCNSRPSTGKPFFAVPQLLDTLRCIVLSDEFHVRIIRVLKVGASPTKKFNDILVKKKKNLTWECITIYQIYTGILRIEIE